MLIMLNPEVLEVLKSLSLPGALGNQQLEHLDAQEARCARAKEIVKSIPRGGKLEVKIGSEYWPVPSPQEAREFQAREVASRRLSVEDACSLHVYEATFLVKCHIWYSAIVARTIGMLMPKQWQRHPQT